ncbi:hypothetical protein CVT24_011941 [Panaeolus cyanescens]|uniref:F-box domain-containing protein n=1 Tax=Panaeolus cyanescens TaxID=181874 RepID=A0A409VYX8_9AGAR|nr:hypothetical protein CVT24_011941 [Panaeolus cyanescens]
MPSRITLGTHNIPIELFNSILFALIAQQPLGPPTQLIPLLLTSKQFHNAISTNTSLLAQICRLKLDINPISRRAFTPTDTDLSIHLVKSFRMINQLRRRLRQRTYSPHYPPWNTPPVIDDDHLSDGDILHELYLLRLDSDGKNYAQLEYAGVRDWVRDVVLKRLFEDAERNDGWPLENPRNACALWLMWMFTLRVRLF